MGRTSSATLPAAGAVQTSRARVLIVDDRPSNVDLLRSILREAGYRAVLGLGDPCRAAEVAAAFEPDVVLLDLRMPVCDGFSVLAELAPLRGGPVLLPVIVLTAETDPEVRQRALASGARDFVSKPFDAAEVLLRIANLLEIRALHRALAEENRRLEARVRARTRDLEDAHAESLGRLAQAAELHDDDTGQHTRRVGESAARLGEALGLPSARVRLLRLAAPLHDVGKIAVPDAVLRKPGPLTDAERAVMRGHAEAGARVLAGGRAEAVRMAEEIARAHHERWDGAGYPHGLREDGIPLCARIVAVADVVDALSHDRPYRAAWSPERVRGEVRRVAGSHFDPRVAAAWLRTAGRDGGLAPSRGRHGEHE